MSQILNIFSLIHFEINTFNSIKLSNNKVKTNFKCSKNKNETYNNYNGHSYSRILNEIFTKGIILSNKRFIIISF